jgi:hydrogenase-1 operon protein HyaF
MSRLREIPIRIEPWAPDNGLGGGGVTALLHEIVALLERLASTGEAAAIDLRSLPMTADERAELRRALGTGEVGATLNAEGISTIQEAGVPGVWWVEHQDRHGEIIAELLEVTRVPDILASAADEIAAGARSLRAQISRPAASAR